MSQNFAANSPSYLLYSPHRALDAVLDLGALPRRLLRVFYPLWRVRVTGQQRVAHEFEDVEWFIIRGIHEGNLTTVADLAQFFGLTERIVQRTLDFLREIGHLQQEAQQFRLTARGRESVQAQMRYEEHHLSTWLYFDGLDSQPLTRAHYAIPVYADIVPHTAFRALYPFERLWDTISLERLMQRPDRRQFNLPDELTHIEPPVGQAPVYLPIYIIERYPDTALDLPPFLVFSRVRGLRDALLESVINVDVLTHDALQSPRTGDLARAVRNYLTRRGLEEDTWYVQQNTPWGAQVMVDGDTLRRLSRRAGDNTEKRPITIRDVGRYLLVYDWCVWLTCDDVALRQESAVVRLLEWVQFAPSAPRAAEVTQRVQQMVTRLRIASISLDDLLETAARLGMDRALARLEGMERG